MSIGYVWVVFSYFMPFEFPSSGSILGCSALVAEVFFSTSEWRKIASNYDRKARLTWHGEDGSTSYHTSSLTEATIALNFIDPKKRRPSMSSMDALRLLGHPYEFNTNKNGESEWYIDCTSDRIEKRMSIIIAAIAVIGAVIWGYGHCLDPAAC